MTNPAPDRPIEAVPTVRLGDRAQRRRSNLLAALIAATVILVVAGGWFGDGSRLHPVPGATQTETTSGDVSVRPSGSTPSPRPPAPIASFWAGPHPEGVLPLLAPDLALIDLSTGAVSGEATAGFVRGALVRRSDGEGWTCLCLEVGEGAPPLVTAIHVVHLSSSGHQVSSDLAERLGATAGVASSVGGHIDAVVSADGRLAYLVTSLLTDSGWRLALELLDLDSGSVRQHADVLSVPLASIPGLSNRGLLPNLPASGPSIRLSPDGRSIFGWASIDEVSPSSAVHNVPLAWAADLGLDGAIVAVRQLSSPAATAHECDATGFSSPTILVTVCPTLAAFGSGVGDGSAIDVRAFGLDGAEMSSASFPGQRMADFGQPLFDLANAVIYLWDARSGRLLVIDVRDGLVRGPSDTPASPATRRALWGRSGSSLALSADGTLIGAPAGDSIYGLATGPDADGPSSIWVFDLVRGTAPVQLAPWPGRGTYTSLAATDDGAWVVAAGAPSGDPAAEGPTLAVHDAGSGQVAAWFTDLETRTPLLLGTP